MKFEIESKEQLIAEIDKRLEDKIIEKTNAELLKKLIKNADSLTEAISIAELGTTYKRTGFHFDKRLEKTENTIKYFKKNENLSFVNNPDNITHKLIIGDNYDALLNLLIEYRSEIDVIYIDPPYGKDKMGQFAKTNYENAITRDNLLSMLYPRLQLAKQLLSDEGVIFCSIDDRNQAYVKCLLDEIFGEKNFIATFCKKGVGAKQDSKTYAVKHEYVIVYAKNEELFIPARDAKELTGYNLISEDNRYYKTQLLRKWGAKAKREDRPNLYYPIYYNPSTKDLSLEPIENSVEIYPKTPEGDGRWRWKKSTMQAGIENKRIEIKLDNKEYIAYERLYKDEAKNFKPFTTWLDDIKNDGADILKAVITKDVFDYPKPVDLIVQLLKLIDSRYSIILDFFAGSGTTGQAVLELNKKDNGCRQCILCTLNEITDLTPNGVSYDVTSKRLKRIMTGSCYDGSNNFDWLKKNKPYGDNLEVVEIASVSNSEDTIGKTAFDVIDETLYGKEKFKTLKEKIDWVCNNFDNTQKVLKTNDDSSNNLEVK